MDKSKFFFEFIWTEASTQQVRQYSGEQGKLFRLRGHGLRRRKRADKLQEFNRISAISRRLQSNIGRHRDGEEYKLLVDT